MTIKTFQFMAENAGQWYQKLPPKEKKKIETSVNRLNKAIEYVRMNGLPKHYHGAGERLVRRLNVDVGRDNANPSRLPDEAVFAMDQVIVRTVEDQAIFQKAMASVTTVLSEPRWENKNYKIVEVDVNSAKTYPEPDKSFQAPTMFTIGVEPEKTVGMGFSQSYEIPWSDIAQARGSIYSPEFYYALIAAERMGIIIDENGWLGGAGLHMKYDTKLKGALNHASIQSFTEGTLTTYGGPRLSLYSSLLDMKGVFQAGEIFGVCSSGWASQMFYNHQGFGNDDAEIKKIKEELLQFIPEMWVDDRIIGATPTNANQLCAILKRGRTLCNRKIVYPVQNKPMSNKVYPENIKEAILYGDINTWYGNSPFPITVLSHCDTTDTGFIPNGRLW